MIAAARTLVLPAVTDVQRELSRLEIPPEDAVRLAGRFFGRTILLSNIVPEDLQLIHACCDAAGIPAVSASDSVLLAGNVDLLLSLCETIRRSGSACADILRDEILRNGTRKTWRTSRRLITFDRRPLVMGILNVTPDSFSDAGSYFDHDRAVDRALEMEAAGADIIDIGGESTRPFAEAVDEKEELRRVIPVIERLVNRLQVPISIDTYKASVARAAVDAGAEIINDVSGFVFDPDMASVVAATGAGAVIMHTRGRPVDMQKDTAYADLVSEVIDGLSRCLATADEAGIDQEKMVIDPGLGFGKSREGNLEILRRLKEFECFGLPILVGSSRKSFTGKLFGRDLETRMYSTAATVALAVANGGSILRVHDVREMRDVADMAEEVSSSC